MNFDFKTFFSKTPVLLAPMAGVTDDAMRELCIEKGADLGYTEMVSAKGLLYANEKTRSLIQLAPNENYVSVQLFGHDADIMAKQAQYLQKTYGEKIAYIDINMGCPAHKIESKGDGSALMRDPENAQKIIRLMVSECQYPITAKFRRGVTTDNEICVEFAQALEQAGASAVAIHGRYVDQYYHGESDNECIARVKRSVSIPVIGNGDISSVQDALEMIENTQCDALMIGRGAMGNPWIFSEIKAALAGDLIPVSPTIQEKMEMAARHARMLAQKQNKSMVRMRKHAAWYMAGVPFASMYRGKINVCTTLDDFLKLFEEVAKNAS